MYILHLFLVSIRAFRWCKTVAISLLIFVHKLAILKHQKTETVFGPCMRPTLTLIKFGSRKPKVIENANFKRWRYEEESQLLWVKGDPGKGKTMLLCGIINELSKSTRASETTIIFFFCQAADARINNATSVLRGLIFMFVDRHPSLISHVRRQYDKGGAKVFEDANAWYALLRALTNILQDPLLQTTYLIIDALDECTTGLSKLLDLIVEKSALHPRVKWLVSSRNWSSIEQNLEVAPKKERLWLELNQASVSEAVGFFIHAKVDALTETKNYSDDIRDAVLQHLLTNAHGTFLWVALVCEELARFDVPKRAFRRKLQQIPAGLDQLYQRMLNDIEETEDPELCKSILRIITIVYRPITLNELGIYIELPRDVQFSDLDQIIGLCGSFLTLRGSTIFLVHQSAKDFLLRNGVYGISPRGKNTLHYEVFSKSLYAMSYTLRRDIYDLSHPGYPIARVMQPQPDPLAVIGYACLYWVDHLEMCSHQFCASIFDAFREGGAVDAFFGNNYLHWLEAISLMRSMPEGTALILKLERFIENAFKTQSEVQNASLLDRAKDASRFNLYHQKAIRNWPLQVYASALIFSPVNSVTKIQYQTQQPSWIIQKPDMEYQWTPCLQTLEGHTGIVISVCFSHDSRLLASASTDCTVKIWNSSSGECLTTLEHSAMVKSVSFSDDSGLRAMVTSVSFSDDSGLLALANDSTIQLWDTSNWQRITTMEDNGSGFNFVTFFVSRESQSDKEDSIFLASGSSDGTLKLWNAQNGECFKIVKGHSGAVSKIAVSHDCQLLASASSDGTIKVWDLKSGECIHILRGFGNAICSVAFSHDSELLASLDQSIKLWKTSTWECLHTLGDSTSLICLNTVKFSHDSKLLASGSTDNVIILWDTSSGQQIRTFSGHRSTVTSIAFSHDSKLLASVSSDRTVRLWDATSSQHLNNFESHCHASPIFSDDSRLLASASDSDHYYIKIWDARNGRCLQRIKAWNSRLHNSGLLSKVEHLRSHPRDRIARVWDPHNLECWQAIKAKMGVKRCFLDNPDLESLDGTVKLSSVFLDGPNEHSHLTLSHYQNSGLGVHGECITWNSECLLWLPPDYRPFVLSSTVISESTVCICCASGRVLFFTFDSAMLSRILAAPDTGKVRS
ncbi:hypothetical protein N7504_005947 [Penicillium tannophilum]|nr:hypothetical protein N7504_005947 [Penicillium tannophilum]